MKYLLRLAWCLLATAILLVITIFLVISQGGKIRQLQKQVNDRETTWTKQLEFNEAITNRVLRDSK